MGDLLKIGQFPVIQDSVFPEGSIMVPGSLEKMMAYDKQVWNARITVIEY